MSLLIDLLQTSQHPNDKSLQQDSFFKTLLIHKPMFAETIEFSFISKSDKEILSLARLK